MAGDEKDIEAKFEATTAIPSDEESGPETSAVDDVADQNPEDARVAEMIAQTIDVPALADVVQQQRPADAADTLESLEDQDAVELLEQMDDQAAAEALAEMQGPLAASVMTDLTADEPSYAATLLSRMAPDDAADLLQSLDEPIRQTILRVMARGPAGQLAQLIAYDEESAGGMMTTDVLTFDAEMTVEKAIQHIRISGVPEATEFVPVIDDTQRLVGVLHLRRLLLSGPTDRIGDLMRQSVVAVRTDVDREEVARVFDRYDYSMLPVIDGEDHLLGIVTVDDVIDIIRAEQTEDVQKSVGAGAEEAVYSSIGQKLRGRAQWMSISLIMTCAAAYVILAHEDLVAEHRVLPFLLPVIAALVGNAGHQALAVSLRGIVLGEVRRDRVVPLLVRELLVGSLLGVLLGSVLLAFTGIMGGDWRLGLVAGCATAVSMSIGTLAGSSVPLIMRRFGIDPAQASAIFLIMITDALAFSTLLFLTAIIA